MSSYNRGGFASLPLVDLDRAEARITKDFEYREGVYASCWTVASPESYALWSVYSGQGRGVLLYVDRSNLANSLDYAQLDHRAMTYIGHDLDLSDSPVTETIFRKTKHFKFEHEYRFILDSNRIAIPPGAKPTERGLLLPVDVDLTQSAAVIGYGVEPWAFAAIVKAAASFGYPKSRFSISEINWSSQKEEALTKLK